MCDKGLLVRLRHGLYEPARAGRPPDEGAVWRAVASLGAGYVSFGTACAHHDLLRPDPDEVQLAWARPRRPVRLGGRTGVFVSVRPGEFRGVDEVEVHGAHVPMACLERALLSSIGRPGLAGGVTALPQLVRAAASRTDWDRLFSLLVPEASLAVVQRLGFLLDGVDGFPDGQLRARLAALGSGGGPILFGPRRRFGAAGPLNRAWKVRDNVGFGLEPPSDTPEVPPAGPEPMPVELL